MHTCIFNFRIFHCYSRISLLVYSLLIFNWKEKKKLKQTLNIPLPSLKFQIFRFSQLLIIFSKQNENEKWKLSKTFKRFWFSRWICLALDGCWMEESSKLFQLIFISYIAQLDCAGFTTKFIALRVRACCDDQQINNVRMLRMSWKIWKNLLDHAVAEIKRILIAHRSLYYDELNKIQHHRHHLVISHKSLISDFLTHLKSLRYEIMLPSYFRSYLPDDKRGVRKVNRERERVKISFN